MTTKKKSSKRRKKNGKTSSKTEPGLPFKFPRMVDRVRQNLESLGVKLSEVDKGEDNPFTPNGDIHRLTKISSKKLMNAYRYATAFYAYGVEQVATYDIARKHEKDPEQRAEFEAMYKMLKATVDAYHQRQNLCSRELTRRSKESELGGRA